MRKDAFYGEIRRQPCIDFWWGLRNGETIAILYAKEGAQVAIVGRNENKVNKILDTMAEVGPKFFC